MDFNFSNKIRLLLNELAILNQPEQIAGEIRYEKDVLLKIKSLGSEIYFLSEKAFEQSEFAGEEQAFSTSPSVESTPDIPIESAEKSNEIIANPPAAIKVEPEPDLSPEELEDNSIASKTGRTADSVNSQISFTRRFEYINNLFGGNAELYLEFLGSLAESKTEEEAMAKYKLAFQENHWSKKEETAHDLKKVIHKIF